METKTETESIKTDVKKAPKEKVKQTSTGKDKQKKEEPVTGKEKKGIPPPPQQPIQLTTGHVDKIISMVESK